MDTTMNLLAIFSYSYNWLPKEPLNEKSHFILEHALKMMLFLSMAFVLFSAISDLLFFLLGYDKAYPYGAAPFIAMVSLFSIVYCTLIIQRHKKLNIHELDLYAELCKKKGLKSITNDVTKADLAKIISHHNK